MRKLIKIIIVLILALDINKANVMLNDENVINTNPVNEIQSEDILVNQVSEIENITEDVIENTEIQEKETEEINTEQEIAQPVIKSNPTPKENITKPEQQVVQKVQEQPKAQPKQETIPVQEHKEEPKVNNEPVKINPEPKKEEVKAPKYCVEGGTIHLEGDGAGEHGYYNSWDEAFNAMNSYTAGWETFNYKIGACPCGKYYFKVTK